MTLEQQPNASDDVAVYMPLYAAPPASERERIRREHAEWSDKTFGDVGPVGPLKHLSKEALETAAEPDDLSEWADMQFLLWDAQRRAGISDEQITLAMVEKLAVNKKREWPEPKNGEPRLHIKEQPVPVVPDEWTIQDAVKFCRETGRQDAGSAMEAWNACRAAMLQGVEPVSNHDELALYYLQGQKDGLEWAAQLAEANHPLTGDWLYDDPLELAKAIRKGPDMPGFAGSSPVTPDGWISCSERMPAQDDWVLIYSKYGEYLAGQVQGEYVELNDGTLSWLGAALHWMPLPEPPQEVNRG
ncbi:dATP/dGTP pyrophosphohydrolase domain-containing protein [Salmonella enterica]|uniref:dATP/dGTP pyrophosphohydrolase domain-containing protein n=1 Tax=Salmonella enterica TaxID=28901 RepID=UPI002F2B7841